MAPRWEPEEGQYHGKNRRGGQTKQRKKKGGRSKWRILRPLGPERGIGKKECKAVLTPGQAKGLKVGV